MSQKKAVVAVQYTNVIQYSFPIHPLGYQATPDVESLAFLRTHRAHELPGGSSNGSPALTDSSMTLRFADVSEVINHPLYTLHSSQIPTLH